MATEDGYRKPLINEFVNGFDFEVYSEGYDINNLEDYSGWYKYTFGIDNWRDLEDLSLLLQKDYIRTKT